MRKAAEFDQEQLAYGFMHVLFTHQIEAQVAADAGHFEVWVLDDVHLQKSFELLQAFKNNPSPQKGPPVRIEVPDPDDRSRTVDVRNDVWRQEKNQNLTILLIGICSAVFIVSSGDSSFLKTFLNYLFYSEYEGVLFKEVSAGQVWRVVTPIFLHFGILHIIFNMMWLYQLGSLIETLGSTKKLLLMTLIIGGLSNTLQYVISGPLFGGMSGVIYGFLAYAWGMGRWQLSSRYYIDKGTFGFMMVWLVLCFTGMFGPVANFAHLGGLLVGIFWAFLESGQWRRISRG